VRDRYLPRLLAVASLLAVAVLLSGCGVFSGPQNTFAPAGTVAKDQKNIFLFTMWPALLILILVEGMLLFILIRFRRKKNDPGLPPQTHGNNALEIGWTIAPVLLLAFFVPPTISGIVHLGKVPKDAMQVQVVGHQWFWEFKYPDPAGGTPIQAPFGELHIPVNRDIGFTLTSPDVIHSFWMPKLAGKTDVIPGRQNHMWIKATQIGTFHGQCAEFCGLDHAQMKFIIVVQSQEDFDAWLEQQASAQRGTQAALALHGVQ
jgi:cytochrome c oxidase subunit 2